ncbi:MAG TPA: hypothetical protein VGD60_11810 [Candidatus Acidoferrales bacterium]
MANLKIRSDLMELIADDQQRKQMYEFILEEVDLIEDRLRKVAIKAGVPSETLIEGVSLEIVGRFLGKMREEKEKRQAAAAAAATNKQIQ